METNNQANKNKPKWETGIRFPRYENPTPKLGRYDEEFSALDIGHSAELDGIHEVMRYRAALLTYSETHNKGWRPIFKKLEGSKYRLWIGDENV